MNHVDFINSKLPIISSEPRVPYLSNKPLKKIPKKRKVFYKYFKDDVEEEEIEEIEELFIRLLDMYCADNNID